MIVSGGLTNSCEKKRGSRQRRKGKIHPSECSVQTIARGDKKAFLSDQCKEIKENNRMGETKDLFKKIWDAKGTFHAKTGAINDRNSMDLTEAEDIKKRWQKYTEERYKKDLHDPDNHHGVITHLEPDILECKVRWALAPLLTNLVEVMDSSCTISNPKRWCCESAAFNMPANLKNSAGATGLEKISFHSNSKERQC